MQPASGQLGPCMDTRAQRARNTCTNEFRCLPLQGGFTALLGAWIIGPRIGRFKDGKLNESMTGHSQTLVVMGTLLLWFGW